MSALADELDDALDQAEEQLRLVRCFLALGRDDAAMRELQHLGAATVRDLVTLVAGARTRRKGRAA